jgi:hypothetical protein
MSGGPSCVTIELLPSWLDKVAMACPLVFRQLSKTRRTFRVDDIGA